MLKLKLRARSGLTFLIWFSIIAHLPAPVSAEPEHFITTQGSKFMDGDKEFRFLSFNVPTLNYVEDNMSFEQTNPYALPSEFELRDLYETVKRMGGRVVRTYTIPVRNKNFPRESVTYVEGPGEFNEEAFKALDKALALAAEYDIRVIIPLVNNWQWMGGRPNYADFRGKSENEFWTDRQLIDDFKKTIDFVLNRTNTITGVKYKDDKTIFAWESGNELENPPEWGIEIARYVKSIDENHLFIDGFFAIHGVDHHIFVQQYSIDEPAIDVISTHHYELNSKDMVNNLKATVKMVDGKKPLLLGEFGFIGTAGMERVIDYLIDEEAIPGALAWSLRRHHPAGGFYQHTEPFGHGIYRAYHWPGFDDGVLYDERNFLSMFREKAFEFQGKSVPPISAPKAPTLLAFTAAPKFSWQGSAGASGYDIQRSTSEDGQWKVVAHNIDDVDTPGFDLFSDESAKIGDDYYYRVVALNEAGPSEPSNTVGPFTVEYLTRVDYARHLMTLDSHSGLTIKSGDYRSYKEAFSRISGEKGHQGSYTIPGKLKAFRLFAYESSEKPSLVFTVSENGIDYREVKMDVEEFKSSEDNYDYLVPRLYSIEPKMLATLKDIEFIQFKLTDKVDIVRTEIDYR